MEAQSQQKGPTQQKGQNQQQNPNQPKKGGQEPDVHQLLKVRREKLAELQAAGKDPFLATRYDVTAHSMDVKEGYAQWEGKEVSMAGRMMSKRVMGKASFCNLQDLKGKDRKSVV